MDYSKLKEITVQSQTELDAIPEDYKGRIYIEFGTQDEPAVVNLRYYYSVIARGNSSVVAWEYSSVVAWEYSSVVAWEYSSVEAWGNSSVEARGNSSVVARGNTQVNQKSAFSKITISGNARIVYDPKTTNDYIDFYGIKHTKTRATLYKAVHKIDGRYVSDYDKSFTYEIGKIIKTEVDPDTSERCGRGIHLSHLNWALGFGSEWDDLAILEVTTRMEDIVCPENTDGKVRTSRVKVIREVPLNECGVYGKILANRRKNNEKE